MHKYLISILIAGTAFSSGAIAAEESQPVSLDLKSAAQLALTSNPQISSAGASVDIFKAGIKKAESAFSPNIGLESGYSFLSKETLFGTTSVWGQNTVANKVVFQQTLFSGGRFQANLNRAQKGYLAATHAVNATRADVIADVSKAYFRAKQARETIDVAESSIKSLEASHDAAKKMHDSGIVTNSDVLRAQVAVTSAKDNLITTKNNYDVAIAALRSAIGLTQDKQIDLAAEPVDSAPDTAVETIPAERSEISASAAYIQALEAGKISAAADKKPTVAVSADYFNQPAGSQFPRLSNTLMFGLVVRYNAFDGGMARANIEEADASIKKARQDLESQKRRVEFEQQAAKLDLDSANARVQTTASQVQLADEIVRVLQAGYKEGITPLTDVLSAESALTAARVNRLAALYDVKIAQVNLLRAYGQTDILIR